MQRGPANRDTRRAGRLEPRWLRESARATGFLDARLRAGRGRRSPGGPHRRGAALPRLGRNRPAVQRVRSLARRMGEGNTGRAGQGRRGARGPGSEPPRSEVRVAAGRYRRNAAVLPERPRAAGRLGSRLGKGGAMRPEVRADAAGSAGRIATNRGNSATAGQGHVLRPCRCGCRRKTAKRATALVVRPCRLRAPAPPGRPLTEAGASGSAAG